MPEHVVEPVHPVDPESPGAKRLAKLGGRLKSNIESAVDRVRTTDPASDPHNPYRKFSMQGSIRDAAQKYKNTLPEYYKSWTKSAETTYRLSGNADQKFADVVSRSLEKIGKGLEAELKSWADVTSPESAYDPDRIADVAEELLNSLEEAWKVVKWDFGEVPYADRHRLSYGENLDAALIGLSEQIHERLTAIGAGKAAERITMDAAVKEMVSRASDDPVRQDLDRALERAKADLTQANKAATSISASVDRLKAALETARETRDNPKASAAERAKAEKDAKTLPLEITTAVESLKVKKRYVATKQQDVTSSTKRISSYAAALRDAQATARSINLEDVWRSARDAVLNGLGDVGRSDVSKALGAALDGGLADQLQKWREAKSAKTLKPADLQARATRIASTIDVYRAAMDAALHLQGESLGDAGALWDEAMSALSAIRDRVLTDLDVLFKHGAFSGV
jgi:hypothetical protein